MRGFSKYIWILFIVAIAYNIFIWFQLITVYNNLDELYLGLQGIKSEAIKDLSIADIKSEIENNIWLKNKFETFNFVFLILNGILTILLISRNWDKLFGSRRIKNKTPFQELPKEEQNTLLFDRFCNQCVEKKLTIFKEEKILLGTPYIIVNCGTCNQEIKIKDSW